ncbi:MAG: hypothetical protein LBV45_05680 [Xanthomonadaceae bacterium]|jgi:hypothetical protein|nr:hypothetical protein [Xanthomonadaceae bacterium]
MKEYRHVAIDKNNIGLSALRQSIKTHGIQTANSRGIVLAPGSMRLEHHLHVFLWDDSFIGQRHYLDLVHRGSCVAVWIRWHSLAEPTWFSSGTLKGDNPSASGPPHGKSTNGAWAYKGNIPANYCFVVDLDTVRSPGYGTWQSGMGWNGRG